MITLAEKLAALQIEIGVQLIANDVIVLVALTDIVRTGGDEKTLLRLTQSLKENTQFIDRVTAKVETLKKEPPRGN